MRRRRIVGAVLLAAAAYFAVGYAAPRIDWIRAFPPDPAAAPPSMPTHRIAGALHVHTGRSHDAIGTEREIARAARRAGLDFVILTDHPGEATASAVARAQAFYLDDVLLVRGQELSLGHGVGRVLLAGADTVLDEWDGGTAALGRWIERHSGIAMVAHPRSPRTRDGWRSGTEGMHAWEVLDLADVARARLAGPWVVYHSIAMLVGYPVGRLDRALRGLYREGFDRPGVAAYDSARATGPLTAVAGLDVHAKTRLLGRPLPPYLPFFRALVNHVELSAALPDAPDAAADSVLAAIRRGDVSVSFGPAAEARGFAAHDSASVLRAGRADGSGRILYRVFRNGRAVAWVRGPVLAWPMRVPGLYRVEAYRYSFRIGPLYWNLRPWMLTNPKRPDPAMPAGESIG